MPELPEVETIKRGLEPKLVGKQIISVKRLDVQPSQHPRGQFYVDEDQLSTLVIGAHVQTIRRRAKVLLIDLDTEVTLMIHLKMTGQIILEESLAARLKELSNGEADEVIANNDRASGGLAIQHKGTHKEPRRFGGGHPTKSMVESLPDNSTRTFMKFENGSILYFNDQRKFGWIKLLPSSEVEEHDFMQRIGPEPWSDEFTPNYLKQKLANRTIAIKPAILDQSTVAGVGNIYADEALNLAKIDPRRSANTLSDAQYAALHSAIPKVMEDSIERGGTSFSNYVNHLGLFGDYLQNARVFKREGKPCLNCGEEIIKIKLSGRGTHYCSNCQN